MNTLIIGGTRFLGAAIARELLSRGHRVSVLHRGETPGDLPDAVTHLLGNTRDRAFVDEQLKQHAYDIVFDTILQAEDLEWMLPVLRAHTGGLVHCGSTGVYAPAKYAPSRESDDTPCPPEMGGFAAKLRQDEALIQFHRDTGFYVCSLRVSNVFGAGDVPLDGWGGRNPQYFQWIADGREILIPERGLPLLQPVHVDDLARGFCQAMERRDVTVGQIYNLSSERAVSLDEYFALTRELLDSSSSHRYVSIDELIALNPRNEGGIRFLCEHMCIDSSKAARDFEYTPRIGVREGLRDSLEWMVSRGLLEARIAQ